MANVTISAPNAATATVVTAVDQLIKGKGYDTSPDNEKGVGVFVDIKRPHQFLLFRWDSVRTYRGAVLWVKNATAGADEKNWVMQVFGRNFLDRFSNLATEIGTKFKVNVRVQLHQEDTLEHAEHIWGETGDPFLSLTPGPSTLS